VLDASVVFKDAAYEVTTPNGIRKVPPSSHYGFRSVLRLTH